MTEFRRAAPRLGGRRTLCRPRSRGRRGRRRAAIRVHDVRTRFGRGGLARLPVFAAAEAEAPAASAPAASTPRPVQHPAPHARWPPWRVGALHDPELDVVEAVVLHVLNRTPSRGNIRPTASGRAGTRRGRAQAASRSGGWAPVGISVDVVGGGEAAAISRRCRHGEVVKLDEDRRGAQERNLAGSSSVASHPSQSMTTSARPSAGRGDRATDGALDRITTPFAAATRAQQLALRRRRPRKRAQWRPGSGGRARPRSSRRPSRH